MSFTIPRMYPFFSAKSKVLKRAGERCATARIVHDVFHDSTNVSFFLCEVQGSETSWGDSLRGVGLEDAARSAPLHSDDSSKSKVLKRAGETLFEVWALKMPLAPRLCILMT